MKAIISLTLACFLAGCAAAQLSLEKRELDIQTKTASAIFVAPVSSPSPKLFLNIRSSVAEFDGAAFRASIGQKLGGNGSGYTLTDEPAQADYLLSVSVLNLEKAMASAAELALEHGYGGPSITQSLVELSDFYEFGDPEDFLKALAATLVIGAVEGAINAAVQDVAYMLVTDIEVAESLPEGGLAKVDTDVTLTQGDGGQAKLQGSTFEERVKYRTRIVTTANRANLKLEEAKDKMFDQMAFAIAGIFAQEEPQAEPMGPSEPGAAYPVNKDSFGSTQEEASLPSRAKDADESSSSQAAGELGSAGSGVSNHANSNSPAVAQKAE